MSIYRNISMLLNSKGYFRDLVSNHVVVKTPQSPIYFNDTVGNFVIVLTPQDPEYFNDTVGNSVIVTFA